MQRRTVLRSAVKLAYATPLVVATVRLDQKHAAASPGPGDGCGYTCRDECCNHPCIDGWCNPPV